MSLSMPIHFPDERHMPDMRSNALPSGLLLREFEIIETLHESRTGIVYLAWDRKATQRAALKEYLPAAIASRPDSRHAAPFAQADAYTAGLHAFLNEARILSECHTPSLVKPYRWLQANGTAYSASRYQEGTALDQAFRQGRIVPKEDWLRGFLACLLDAVEALHTTQHFHHNIGPDNILLLKNGRPLLLGFGAALRAAATLAGDPDTALKHGYAALEQYGQKRSGGMQTGSCTDVYALAAVMYFLIAGKPLPPAPAREHADRMTPLREAGRGRYSDTLLSTLDRALALRPEQRIQTIAELRYALDNELPLPQEAPPPPRPDAAAWQPLAAEPRAMPPPRSRHPWLAGLLLCTGVVAGASGAYWWTPADAPVTLKPSPVRAVAPAPLPALPVAAPLAAPPQVEEIRIGNANPASREPAPPPTGRADASPPPAAARHAALEKELWELANESGKAGAYQTYLMAYPQGRHAYEAKLRLATLKSAQIKTESQEPTAGPTE